MRGVKTYDVTDNPVNIFHVKIENTSFSQRERLLMETIIRCEDELGVTDASEMTLHHFWFALMNLYQKHKLSKKKRGKQSVIFDTYGGQCRFNVPNARHITKLYEKMDGILDRIDEDNLDVIFDDPGFIAP